MDNINLINEKDLEGLGKSWQKNKKKIDESLTLKTGRATADFNREREVISNKDREENIRNYVENLKNKPRVELEKPEKKMVGALFWIVLALAIIKDCLDIPENLSTLLASLASISGIAISCIIFVYLKFEGVSFIERGAAEKIAILIGESIIELLPFISIVPAATLSLIALRMIENHHYLKLIEKIT